MVIEPIDWLGRWNRLVTERSAQNDRWRGSRASDSDYWSLAANRFAQLTREIDESDPFLAAVCSSVRSDDVLLDVGCGAGRYSVSLAPYVRKVIALDPSPGMLNALRALIAERDLRNIEVVPGSWPKDSGKVDRADVVICAHAFYWEPEIGPFLQAIDAAAARACFMISRAVQPDGYLGDLFERLRGERRSPEPAFLDLYGALTAIGIWPNSQIVDGFVRSYSSMDELLDHAAQLLFCAPDDIPADFIRHQLSARTEVRAGRIWITGSDRLAGIASWTKQVG